MRERLRIEALTLRTHDCRLQRRHWLAMAACRAAMVAAGFGSPSAGAQPAAPGSAVWLEEQFRNVRADLDLALFRLKVEACLAPEVDVHRDMAMLDAMAQHLGSLQPAWAPPAQRLALLRRYLYEAGAWNSHRPIRYDLAYALANEARPGFLHKLLTTRLGNCISMPLLFIALGQRLGLSMSLAQAPNHAFVVYTDPVSGQDIRLEATSGANAIRLDSMRRAMPMSDQAIAEGIYLKKLNAHECMALLAMPLLNSALRSRRHRLAVELADVVLRHVPRWVDAMLIQGSAVSVRMKEDFEKKYPNPAAMPRGVRAAYEQAHRQNLLWFQRAEALGWREPDPEAEERYRRHIQSLLNANGGRTKP